MKLVLLILLGLLLGFFLVLLIPAILATWFQQWLPTQCAAEDTPFLQVWERKELQEQIRDALGNPSK